MSKLPPPNIRRREWLVQFDLRFSIVTISPFEPTLLLSLVVASLAAWFMGTGLGKLTGLVADPWRRRLYMGPVWVFTALMFFGSSRFRVDKNPIRNHI